MEVLIAIGFMLGFSGLYIYWRVGDLKDGELEAAKASSVAATILEHLHGPRCNHAYLDTLIHVENLEYVKENLIKCGADVYIGANYVVVGQLLRSITIRINNGLRNID